MSFDAPSAEAIYDAFQDAHEQLFGTRLDNPSEVVDVWVTAERAAPADLVVPEQLTASYDADHSSDRSPGESRYVFLDDCEAAVYQRKDLMSITPATPCLIEEPNSVTYVPRNASVFAKQSHFLIEL